MNILPIPTKKLQVRSIFSNKELEIWAAKGVIITDKWMGSTKLAVRSIPRYSSVKSVLEKKSPLNNTRYSEIIEDFLESISKQSREWSITGLVDKDDIDNIVKEDIVLLSSNDLLTAIPYTEYMV